MEVTKKHFKKRDAILNCLMMLQVLPISAILPVLMRLTKPAVSNGAATR